MYATFNSLQIKEQNLNNELAQSLPKKDSVLYSPVYLLADQ